MRVLLIGATGATGRLVADELGQQGHTVRGLLRRPDASLPGAVERSYGDAAKLDEVRAAVRGQEAVIVALGIRENPLWVRLRGARNTLDTIRSRGTQTVITAMQEAGVRRVIVLSSYGVGETRGRPSLGWRLLFATLLGPQIRDTEAQERAVRGSGLDWVLVQPVGLTDTTTPELVLASCDGEVASMSISRRSVARALVQALHGDKLLGRTVSLSARPGAK